MDGTQREQLLSLLRKEGFSDRELHWLCDLHARIESSLAKIDPFDLLKPALKHRQMFNQKPETLAVNLERSAAL
jgi:hypothetical protein